MKSFLLPKHTLIGWIAAALIFLYTYTTASKLLDMHGFKTVLTKSPLVGKNAAWLSWIVLITEIIITFFLLMPRFRTVGFISSAILLTAFTVYIGYMIIFIPELPCSCGGVISKLTWPQHLIFNLIFLAFSIVGWKISKRKENFLLQ